MVICSLFWMMQVQLPVSRADASQNFTAGTQINGSVPTVTGVSPSKGAMAGGTTVTGATAVHFGPGQPLGPRSTAARFPAVRLPTSRRLLPAHGDRRQPEQRLYGRRHHGDHHRHRLHRGDRR